MTREQEIWAEDARAAMVALVPALSVNSAEEVQAVPQTVAKLAAKIADALEEERKKRTK